MKTHLIVCCLLALTACTQCSDNKKNDTPKIIKEEKQKPKVKKKIQTVIFYFDYFPDPITWLNKDYPEFLNLLNTSYCYKKIEEYLSFFYFYKGNIVSGKLIARVYKKDGSFFEFPLTTTKFEININRKDFNNNLNSLSAIASFSYFGDEVQFEVRRINKEKNEDVLLYKTKILNLNSLDSNWEELETYSPPPDSSGFNKLTQCHN